MVAIYGKKPVAIECDGERWHSGEVKIRKDMERQTILERIGWRFIRIRSSEYYRNPKKAMNRVISELIQYGIEPEEHTTLNIEVRTSDLLQRIKAKATVIFDEEFSNKKDSTLNIKTITFALSNGGHTVKNEFVVNPSSFSDENSGNKKPTQTVQPSDWENTSSGLETTNMLENQTKKIEKARQHVINTDSGSSTYATNVAHTLKLGYKRVADTQVNTNQVPLAKHQKEISCIQVSKGDRLIIKLSQRGFDFIDNREQSKIIWALYTQEIKDVFEAILEKYQYPYMLEKCGAISTNNKSAWQVVI